MYTPDSMLDIGNTKLILDCVFAKSPELFMMTNYDTFDR